MRLHGQTDRPLIDNNIRNMSDDTTQTTNAAPVDTNTKADETTTTGASVPSFRLKEEAEKRRAAEEENKALKAQLEEKQGYVPPVEVAKAKYGEEVVNSEEVQAVLQKYPGMDYGDAINLAKVATKETDTAQESSGNGGTATPFVGRPATPEPAREMTLAEEKAFLSQQLAEGKISL